MFAHFSRLERRKPISLECPLFRERKFYSPLRNRKRLDTYERPCSLFNLRTVTNSFRVEKKRSREGRRPANLICKSRDRQLGVSLYQSKCNEENLWQKWHVLRPQGSLFNTRNIYFWFLASPPLTKFMSSFTETEDRNRNTIIYTYLMYKYTLIYTRQRR